MVETQDLQERQLDHRFQFALYKEKKLSELEAVRGTALYIAVQHICEYYSASS
jgi:hypothetical protein